MTQVVDAYLHTIRSGLEIVSRPTATALDREVLSALLASRVYSVPAEVYPSIAAQCMGRPDVIERYASQRYEATLPFDHVFLGHAGGGLHLTEDQQLRVRSFRTYDPNARLVAHLLARAPDGAVSVYEILSHGTHGHVARVCVRGVWQAPFDTEAVVVPILVELTMQPGAAARRRMHNHHARELRHIQERRGTAADRQPWYEVAIDIEAAPVRRVIQRALRRPPRAPGYSFDVKSTTRLTWITGTLPLRPSRRRRLERTGYGAIIVEGQLGAEWQEEFLRRGRPVPVRAPGTWIACLLRPVSSYTKGGEGRPYRPATRTLKITPRLVRSAHGSV